MSITVFGTCRFHNVSNSTCLQNFISYTHTTKEVIQLIHFLKDEMVFPSPYNMVCFRTPIINAHQQNGNKTYVEFSDEYKKLFLDTEIFVIEICSKKKYIHNGYYLHHLCVDKRFSEWNHHTPEYIMNNYIVEEQTDDEIESDILEIQRLVNYKKIVVVSHYNSKSNGKYFESRNNLVELLNRICDKHNILFINPTVALSNFHQEQVMTNDLGHYTDYGTKEFGKYMDNYLRLQQ